MADKKTSEETTYSAIQDADIFRASQNLGAGLWGSVKISFLALKTWILSFVNPLIATAVTGTASGDLAGNYPDPTVRKSSVAFALDGTISISLGSNTNNWNPTGLSGANTIKLNATAAIDITGLVGGGSGRIIILHNVNATFSATLKNNSGSSSSGNKFLFADGDLIIKPGQSYFLQHDITVGVWRLLGAVGFVKSVTGLNTDNTDSKNPIVKISVDGSTITGLGTPADPLVATVPAIDKTTMITELNNNSVLDNVLLNNVYIDTNVSTKGNVPFIVAQDDNAGIHGSGTLLSVNSFYTLIDGTYEVSPRLYVNAFTATSLIISVSWTDFGGTPRTIDLVPCGGTTTTKVVSAAGVYLYPSFTINARHGSDITIDATVILGLGAIDFEGGGTVKLLPDA